jgi:hypothetical protein
MLSPKQYAEQIEKPYTTVMTWLQSGQFPTAVKHQTPTGHYWEIPEGARPPELRPGPKPKTPTPNKRGTGQASASNGTASKGRKGGKK